MNATCEEVLESYHGYEALGKLFDTLYAIFFAKSAEIPLKFAKTNMER